MQKLSDLLNHRNTRFRASDSDTIIQADRSACIARGADPPRTSATAAMVDSSIGYLGHWDRLFARRQRRLHRLAWSISADLGGSFSSSRLRPPLHLSSVRPLPSIEIHTAEAAEVRDMVKRQHAERRARWRVWLAPVCGSRKRAFSGAATPPSGVHLLAAAGPWCWDAGDAWRVWLAPVCGSRKRAFSGAATPPSGVHLLAAAGPWC
jgi:rubredoxin